MIRAVAEKFGFCLMHNHGCSTNGRSNGQAVGKGRLVSDESWQRTMTERLNLQSSYRSGGLPPGRNGGTRVILLGVFIPYLFRWQVRLAHLDLV